MQQILVFGFSYVELHTKNPALRDEQKPLKPSGRRTLCHNRRDATERLAKRRGMSGLVGDAPQSCVVPFGIPLNRARQVRTIAVNIGAGPAHHYPRY
jgi:hypothetical protein